MDFTFLKFDSVDSTNSKAAQLARRGAQEGTCVIAGQQTAGRGRLGRKWSSERGTGLYLSIILRPKVDVRRLPLITLLTGVAVHDALKELGLRPDIKWVNDVLIGEKKICGILAETVDTPIGMAVVVGIGVNLSTRHLPPEIAETATSIESETGTVVRVDEFSKVITRCFGHFYSEFINVEHGADTIDNWRRRSTYFTGKPIRITTTDGFFDGVTDGLEENGALRVKSDDDSVTIFQTGDVQRLRSQLDRG